MARLVGWTVEDGGTVMEWSGDTAHVLGHALAAVGSLSDLVSCVNRDDRDRVEAWFASAWHDGPDGELTHRVTSGLALVGAMLLPWLAKRHAPPGTPVQRATRLVLLFMVTEALVGGAIVLLRKVANDLSVARGYWMAAHLVNTFLLLAALVASVYFARPERAVPRTEGRVASRWPFALGLLLMLLTGTTGAVTALGDTLFPAESFQASFAQEFQPGAHPFLRLRVFHPIAALLTAGWLAYVAGTRLEDLGQRGAARTVLALALLQVGLGFVNMLLLAPVWMQLVHLAVADALFMAFVWLALAARGAS